MLPISSQAVGQPFARLRDRNDQRRFRTSASEIIFWPCPELCHAEWIEKELLSLLRSLHMVLALARRLSDDLYQIASNPR